ncbi:hypothetical protein M0802_000451 [Mischocyttarus mexicanus]|nr:hypothetical protein M0802_000451 [Mischocyttarus mexicanus]
MKKSFQQSTPTISRDRIVERKPFGFCCNKKNVDPETFYDRRQPPFKSSLADVIVESGGPNLKFRIQDIAKLPFAIQRITSRTKGAAFLGDCKHCRKALRWYLEDEIALARNICARERQNQYNLKMDKNVEIAKHKKKWHKDCRARRKKVKL